MMTITGIAHMAITVRDMKKSLAFYCDQLGFDHAFQVKDEKGNPWIEYVKIAPKQYIELFHGGNERPDEPDKAVGFHHVCLLVESVADTAKSLEEQGVPLTVKPKRGLGKNWQCWVNDPDGNRIEFLEPDEDSPHNQ